MNNRKYHTVGTDPKYNRQIVERGKKYHTVGTGPKYNRQIVERGKIRYP
jgi:outer membrane receptor for Fe3+-dicitrate